MTRHSLLQSQHNHNQSNRQNKGMLMAEQSSGRTTPKYLRVLLCISSIITSKGSVKDNDSSTLPLAIVKVIEIAMLMITVVVMEIKDCHCNSNRYL